MATTGHPPEPPTEEDLAEWEAYAQTWRQTAHTHKRALARLTAFLYLVLATFALFFTLTLYSTIDHAPSCSVPLSTFGNPASDSHALPNKGLAETLVPLQDKRLQHYKLPPPYQHLSLADLGFWFKDPWKALNIDKAAFESLPDVQESHSALKQYKDRVLAGAWLLPKNTPINGHETADEMRGLGIGIKRIYGRRMAELRKGDLERRKKKEVERKREEEWRQWRALHWREKIRRRGETSRLLREKWARWVWQGVQGGVEKVGEWWMRGVGWVRLIKIRQKVEERPGVGFDE